MTDRKFTYETKEGLSDENRLGTKPLMTEAEIKCIESYLKPEHIVFEYGSGGSTLYFPKFVSKYCTVEHQIHWYRLIRRKIVKSEHLKNKVDMRYIPQNEYFDYSIKKPDRQWFETYIESIGDFGIEKFDIILIDGENRTRGFCAEEVLKYIDKNSIVFIHDYYNRDNLHHVEDYYDVIEKLEEGTTLVVLKKK